MPPAVSLWLPGIEEWGSNAPLASIKLLRVGGARPATLAARIPAEIETSSCGKVNTGIGGRVSEDYAGWTRIVRNEIINAGERPMCPDDEV